MSKRSKKETAALVDFGRRVRSLRYERGLTQEGLAEQTGLHRTVVGYIERGERDGGLTALWRIAEALEVAPAELLTGTPRSGSSVGA
jgi:transcriptional regulator with XRE-family HTH domain